MATKVERFDTLIVDPDNGSRIRLKQALSAVPAFSKVHVYGTSREMLGVIELIDRFDIVFISSLVSREQAAELIKQAKESKQGQDAAFVLVLKGRDQAGATVAASMMAGVDGFLCEPYSVEALVQTTEIARRVRLERSAAREKAAVSIILSDIMSDIDRAAVLVACQVDSQPLLRKVSDKSALFRGMEGESAGVYFDTALSAFEDVAIPVEYARTKQMRVSARLRRKIQEEELQRQNSPESATRIIKKSR